MALDARSRSSIYEKLVPLIGEDNANALMSEFPSVEADELVTKQFLRAELAALRMEVFGAMANLREDLRGEMGSLRDDLRDEMGTRGEALHNEMGTLAGALRGEMAELRIEMADGFRQQTTLLGGGLVGATAVLAAIMSFI